MNKRVGVLLDARAALCIHAALYNQLGKAQSKETPRLSRRESAMASRTTAEHREREREGEGETNR